MLELKRWLREFKEEAPWYFWLLAIPTAILAPFNRHLSVTVLILLSLSASAYFLKKYKLLRCYYLYLLVVVTLFAAVFPVYLVFFTFLDSKGITDSIGYDLLSLYTYMLYTLITTLFEITIIYMLFKLKKINVNSFFQVSLCAGTMTMANILITYIFFMLLLVFTSFL